MIVSVTHHTVTFNLSLLCVYPVKIKKKNNIHLYDFIENCKCLVQNKSTKTIKENKVYCVYSKLTETST